MRRGRGIAYILGQGLGEGIEGVAQVAAATITSVGTMVGGALQGAGSALGGALQGAMTPAPVTIINNVGMVGQTAKKKVTGSGSIPGPKKTSKPSVNVNMPTEKLLLIAVNYLSSIDKTLQNQINFERSAFQQQVQAEKEAAIENTSADAFSELGNRLGADQDRDQTKDASSLSKALIAGTTLAALGLAGLASLESPMDKLGELTGNLNAFFEKFPWLDEFLILLTGAGFGPFGLATALAIIVSREQANQAAKQQEFTDTLAAPLYDPNASFLDRWLAGQLVSNRPGFAPSAAALPANRPDTTDAALESGTTASGREATAQSAVPTTAYDIVYANGQYGDPLRDRGKKLTAMTIGEVIEFQENVLNPRTDAVGEIHTPVGAYQFVRDTLEEVAKQEFGDNWESQIFNAATQDRLARAYYNQQRGGDMSRTWAYTFGSSPGQFANTDFDSVKENIIQREVGGYVGMTSAPPASGAGSNGNNQSTLQSVADMGLDAMKFVGSFINNVGESVVGQRTSSPMSRQTEDNAAAISSFTADIERSITFGRETAIRSEAGLSSAMASLRSGSPEGQIGLIDPNYPGTDIILQYLQYHRLATSMAAA